MGRGTQGLFSRERLHITRKRIKKPISSSLMTSRNVLGREASKGEGAVANIEQKIGFLEAKGQKCFKKEGVGQSVQHR